MKPRSLLVLAIVVAALGAFIWFVERDLPSTDERGERARRVLALERDEVEALEIRVGEERIRLDRIGDAENEAGDEAARRDDDPLAAPSETGWRLVEPMSARADAAAVGDLVAALTGIEKERTLEDADPAAVGLAAPRARVTLTADGEARTLLVGEKVPASANVIVGLEGSPEAYVVSDSFWADLTRPAGDWRSRRAFDVDREDIVAVGMRGAHRVALRRVGDVFELEEPFPDTADEDRVDELLTALTGLEVETFLDGPEAADHPGLQLADATFEVTLEGAETPVEIRVGGAFAEDGEARILAIGERRFTAETELAELADIEPTEWRSTAWTRYEVYEVDAVALRRGEATTRLERREGDWMRDGEEIAYTAASDVLYAVRDVEVASVAEREAFELPAEPMWEIELTGDDGSETLRLYEATAEGHLAERVGRDAVLVLESESVEELLAKIEAARSAEPVPVPVPVPGGSVGNGEG